MENYKIIYLILIIVTSYTLIFGKDGKDTKKHPKLDYKKPPKDSNFKRTVIAFRLKTEFGQYLYLRGGGVGGQPIPIRHWMVEQNPGQDNFYASTAVGDTTLNWGGYEENQGRYQNSVTPQGTPMMWTTNNKSYQTNAYEDGAGFYQLNMEGDHLWVLDIEMDCSKTFDGWFEFKGFRTSDGQTPLFGGWEAPITQDECSTKDGPITFDGKPQNSENHHGLCGEFNLYGINENKCDIYSFKEAEKLAKKSMKKMKKMKSMKKEQKSDSKKEG